MKSETITEYYTDRNRQNWYNEKRIGWELERTAMGDGYYGNALRVAKDIPGVTDEERSLLDRWATGRQSSSDRFRLQDLAMKVYTSGR